MDLIADATFLIGLWRRQAWAVTFARAHADQRVAIPWVVLGEFWHGAIRAGHEPKSIEQFLLLGVPLLDPQPVIPVYANLCARIQQEPGYRSIGQNDLWIASTALAFNRPLVTRNRRHFDLIADLQLHALAEPS